MKIIIKFYKFKKLIISIIEDKKRLKLELLDKKEFLKPGYYHLERAVGYHIFEDKPAALVSSKRFLLSKVKYRYLAPIFAFIEKLLPPFYVKLDGSNNNSASQCLLSREGDVKVFDYTNRKVFIFPSSNIKLLKLIRNKEKLSLYLPVNQIEIKNDENYYIENLAIGDLFSEVKIEKQVEVYKILLDSYISNQFFYEFNYYSSSSFFLSVMQIDFNPHIKIILEKNENEIISNFENSHSIFSHCDFYSNNIIVSNEGFIIIDFEKAAYKPVFFDLLHLVVTEYFEGNKSLLDNVRDNLSNVFRVNIKILFVSYLVIMIDDLSKEINSNTVLIDSYKVSAIKEIYNSFK